MEVNDLIENDSGESLDILEDLHQLCRICLQKGDINIWNFRGNLNTDAYACEDASEETSITPIELMNIFVNSKEDILVLSEVVSLICRQCLNDLKMCYAFYQKLKLASVTIKSLYQETEQQADKAAPSNDNGIQDLSLITCETETESVKESTDDCIEFETNDLLEQLTCENETLLIDASSDTHMEISTGDDHVPSTIDDATGTMVVATFLPSAMNQNIGENVTKQSPDCPSAHRQLTVDYKAVEIYEVSSLNQLTDNIASNENLMFKCKYCPQAFARSIYLQTHARKAHLCKFCTQAFNVTQDLFNHLRTAHKDHKCVICHKSFTTNSNLRYHIKRMHKIELPAGMALIDFIHQ